MVSITEEDLSNAELSIIDDQVVGFHLTVDVEPISLSTSMSNRPTSPIALMSVDWGSESDKAAIMYIDRGELTEVVYVLPDTPLEWPEERQSDLDTIQPLIEAVEPVKTDRSATTKKAKDPAIPQERVKLIRQAASKLKVAAQNNKSATVPTKKKAPVKPIEQPEDPTIKDHYPDCPWCIKAEQLKAKGIEEVDIDRYYDLWQAVFAL